MAGGHAPATCGNRATASPILSNPVCPPHNESLHRVARGEKGIIVTRLPTRLRDFHIFVLLAFALLLSSPCVRADDAFVLHKRAPTLNSLVPRAQPQAAVNRPEGRQLPRRAE